MALRLQPPDHAGARDQAAELVQALGEDLTGEEVLLDCEHVVVGTPSYLDEVVKQVLGARRADALLVIGASARVQQLLERAADNRGVRTRLRVAARAT